MTSQLGEPLDAIAVVGIAGRFPGARGVEELWALLRDGVSGLRTFSRAELEAEGIAADVLSAPGHVPVKGFVEGVEEFDAGFFGMTPREAALTDPQHRVFLECAFEALERAGHAGPARPASIGVYAAVSYNTYLVRNLLSHADVAAAPEALPTVLANDREHAALRVSYKLDLRGPSLAVQTACSGSLVAVHLAVQSLLAGECDMALAGGACLTVPLRAGYRYQEGGIYSPDGACRAFDARAQGTVGGNGVGVVVLRRLADAVADGDHVHAVLLGSAVNNDGAEKVGYTAPSVGGQAAVVRGALAMAGVGAGSVSYVEAHGTGTPLGDPIEVAALNLAFGLGPERRGTCALGSVKTNLGHLDAAAGVAGLIKTALALEHRQIPPSLGYTSPNPAIDFEAGPFRVNASLTPWPAGPTPRRAGVSSFGLGGTNAHVVLEEAPEPAPVGPGRPLSLLLLSARSPAALDASAACLREHLVAHPEQALPDVAFTLQAGRRSFPHRRAYLCRGREDALAVLQGRDPTAAGHADAGTPVAFLFPGQADLRPGALRELYEGEPELRRDVDRCCDALSPRLGVDLREPLVAGSGSLSETRLLQPALFVVEIVLARLLERWGLKPVAVLGHSLGEYAAACVAGVFDLEDALTLVAERGRLMQALPAGGMMAVPLAAERLERRLPPTLALAAVNGPELSVVSGAVDALERLARELAGERVAVLRLSSAHAFHSPLVEAAVEPLARAAAAVTRRAPRLPCLSGPSGDWLRADEATDPTYWARQMRETVRFGPGLARLLGEHERLVLVEVGPGQALSAAAGRHPSRRPAQVAVPLFGRGDADAATAVQTSLARAWVAGAEWDGKAFHSAHGPRRRVPLPTYPFERRRCWIDPAPRVARAAADVPSPAGKRGDPGDWLYVPGWRPASPIAARDVPPERWLLFGEPERVGHVADGLAGAGHSVVRRDGLDPAREIEGLARAGELPRRVVLAGGSDPFGGCMRIARALVRHGPAGGNELTFVGSGLFDVTGEETLDPDAASAVGALRVIPQEHPQLRTRALDLAWSVPAADGLGPLVADLQAGGEPTVALRGQRRWVPRFLPLEGGAGGAGLVRAGGGFLVLGGLGGVGLDLAAFLARRSRGRVVLLSRRGLPEPETWEAHLAGKDAELARRIRGVRRVQEVAASVAVLEGDVADAAAVSRAIAHAERSGGLHGVVFAAGAPIVEHVLLDSTPADWERQLRPKRLGLAALDEALGPRPLDFCLVVSSLAAVLGKPGFAAYVAAHTYADTFVARRNRRRPGVWRAVDWDNWITASAEEAGVRLAPGDLALTTPEAEPVLERVLSPDAPSHLAVSVGDLSSRLRAWVERPAPAAAPPPATARTAHPRPSMAVPYAAPRTSVERLLAGVWADAFGLAEVGIHDAFFDLGGDSLLCLDLVSRAGQAGVKISPRDVYDHQTIASLAGSRPRPVREPSLRPFHYGDPEEPLYGCLHSPDGSRRRHGVLLCQPLAHEHIQFHRACTQLATRLADSGFPTLRFDYHGCGDSSGDTGSGGIERWRRDVSTATGELRRLAGVDRVCLVGIRLGATLALRAAAEDEAAGVVLWDPVPSGKRYLEELHALQKEVVHGSHVIPRAAENGTEELVGFAYHRPLRDELAALTVGDLSRRPAPRALLLTTRPEPAAPLVGETLSRLGVEWSETRLPNPGLWRWMEDVSRQIVRQEALRAAAEWLERGFA